MKVIRLSFTLWALIVPILFCAQVFASCKVLDDKGNHIDLSRPAQRIISLAPDITETLFAIGAGNRIVGVMQGSDFPSAAKNIPVIGSYSGIDLEKLISLHPDLIVSWSDTFSRQLTSLKNMGIPVYVSEPRRLEDVPRTMKNLGCLIDVASEAKQQAESFSQRLASLKKTYHQQKSMTVFYQIGSYSLITINKNSWINQVITLCGGVNVFANATFAAPEISWESLLNANPEVIISDATTANWKSSWSKWTNISAVKNNNLFSINPDIIERASPRLLLGVEQICQHLQAARVKQ